jgi:hypothetical protein
LGDVGTQTPSNGASAPSGTGINDYGVRTTPFSVIYDPKKELLVTFEVPSGSSVNLVTLWIPRGATSEDALFSIDLGEGTTAPGSGTLDFKFNLNSVRDGSAILQTKRAIEIRPWFGIETPRLIEPGTCSTRFSELKTRFLPSSRSVGYYVTRDDRIILLTQRLSRVTNSDLFVGEKVCLTSSNSSKLALSGINRVILTDRTTSPYLAVDLEDKFAGRSIQVQVRRTVTGELETFTIATVRANASGDAIIKLQGELFASDRFRVRVGKLLLPIRTITLMNP